VCVAVESVCVAVESVCCCGGWKYWSSCI